jgi:hypothetical protein
VAITIVNGYLCTSSCDAAKARTGQDPHPQSLTNPNGKPDGTNSTQSPAVTYGGALTGKNAVAPTSASSQANATANGYAPILDIQV